MSIQKKSLINTLKTTKKANIAKEEVTVAGVTATPVTKKFAAIKAPARRNMARK